MGQVMLNQPFQRNCRVLKKRSSSRSTKLGLSQVKLHVTDGCSTCALSHVTWLSPVSFSQNSTQLVALFPAKLSLVVSVFYLSASAHVQPYISYFELQLVQKTLYSLPNVKLCCILSSQTMILAGYTLLILAQSRPF